MGDGSLLRLSILGVAPYILLITDPGVCVGV